MTEPYDYTVMKIGTKTERGIVEKCPYCQKNGLHVTIYDVDWYYHTLASYWADENHTELRVTEETCPSNPAQRAAHEDPPEE